MKRLLTISLTLLGFNSMGQLLSTNVQFPADNSAIEITMDASFGNGALVGHDPNDVYVHTGVITNLSATPGAWRYVRPGNFNAPVAALKATSLGNNRWRFTIPGSIRSFYNQESGGVPGAETILRVSILFRNGAGSKVQRNRDGSDMYIVVYPSGQLAVKFTQPFFQPTYNPIPEPLIKQVGDNIPVTIVSSLSANLRILFNGGQAAAQNGVQQLAGNVTITQGGQQQLVAEATSGGTVKDTINFFVAAATEIAPLPPGAVDGINYSNDNTSATLVLYAPNKNRVVVTGDFNNWQPTLNFQMKRTPDNLRYWLTINGLVPGQEYAYQYIIDDVLTVADYNTEKILDPSNDQFINQAPTPNRYPNLKPYPVGKASGIVSVLEPGKAQYNWQNNNFQRPDKRNLIVYEALIRDFGAKSDFQMMIDTLPYLAQTGINTIHLMPFTEFEGNNSWGYNPMFMFAVDKFYGPENKLREFVDSCHGRGIAVILDMVLNHQFGQSPMVQMYWNSAQNKPAANSPWFNQDATHPFNVGFDMNHESQATKDFVDRVMKHWLQQYRLDGFRWDLSKGFTQTNNPNDAGAWSNYDQSRVNIWQRIYTQSQAFSPGCYMILEHLGVDQEEAALANMGMLLWGKMTDQFNESSMGYIPNSNFDRAYHTTRWSGFGGNNTPHLMAYAESHDEERLAQKNVRFGNTSGNHNTKSPSVYTKRLMAVNAFLYTIPGPKMLWQFGELAYDSSINMCSDFTIGSCRVDPKPPAWSMPGGNYNNPAQHPSRVNLRDTTAKIIRLRTKYPQYTSTYVTNDISFNLGGNIKWQWMRGPQLTVLTAGNFDVVERSASVSFPASGTWYIYTHNLDTTLPGFLGGKKFNEVNANMNFYRIEVPNGQTNQSFTIPAGVFFLFTSVDLNAVVNEYVFNGNGNWSNAANWQNAAIPPANLPAGKSIIINPANDGECVLDVSQTIGSGASLIINAGKRFRITGNLIKN